MLVEPCALMHLFFGNGEGVRLLEHGACALIRIYMVFMFSEILQYIFSKKKINK